MSITVGDVLRVVAIIQWLDGDIMQNVFNAVITGSGGPYDDADIVDDAVAWVNEMYANLTSNTVSDVDGSEVKVYLYDSVDDDWDEVGTDAWSWNPVHAGQWLPKGNAALINCRTTDPDVSGKKYIGGFSEDAMTDGLWISVITTALANFADDWLTAFTGSVSGASWVPGVWSPTKTNFYAASGTYTVPLVSAYQRRRKPGVGI
jgi:hypothetical protein